MPRHHLDQIEIGSLRSRCPCRSVAGRHNRAPRRLRRLRCFKRVAEVGRTNATPGQPWSVDDTTTIPASTLEQVWAASIPLQVVTRRRSSRINTPSRRAPSGPWSRPTRTTRSCCRRRPQKPTPTKSVMRRPSSRAMRLARRPPSHIPTPLSRHWPKGGARLACRPPT